MQRILVPTDFSREAENALQTAIPIARAFNATLIILHILELNSSDLVTIKDDLRIASPKLRASVQEAQENLKRSSALHNLDNEEVQFKEMIRIGGVGVEIEKFIGSEGIELVVMGTKSVWGFEEVLLGTTTDRLLRKVDCPVLSVNRVVPPENFKKIIFPTTTEYKEKMLIDLIKNFQRLFGSKIYLVRINTPMHFLPDRVSLNLLNQYAEEHELTDYEAYVYSHNDEEEGIREFAHNKDAGLIALSTSAHTGFWKIIQGSVTKDVVSHSTRPVLTMKIDSTTQQ